MEDLVVEYVALIVVVEFNKSRQYYRISARAPKASKLNTKKVFSDVISIWTRWRNFALIPLVKNYNANNYRLIKKGRVTLSCTPSYCPV